MIVLLFILQETLNIYATMPGSHTIIIHYIWIFYANNMWSLPWECPSEKHIWYAVCIFRSFLCCFYEIMPPVCVLLPHYLVCMLRAVRHALLWGILDTSRQVYRILWRLQMSLCQTGTTLLATILVDLQTMASNAISNGKEDHSIWLPRRIYPYSVYWIIQCVTVYWIAIVFSHIQWTA